LWSLKVWKCSHLLARNKNNFWRLPHFFLSLNFLPIFIFLPALRLLINA
jgi:hypothetical protein